MAGNNVYWDCSKEDSMSNAVLENEIENLPQAAVDEVIDFIRFLKSKFPQDSLATSKKSMYGIWKGDHFFMSQDFDDPIDDFAEYM